MTILKIIRRHIMHDNESYSRAHKVINVIENGISMPINSMSKVAYYVISQMNSMGGICNQIGVDADKYCKLRKYCSSLQRRVGT